MSHIRQNERPVPQWPTLLVWPFTVTLLNLLVFICVGVAALFGTRRVDLETMWPLIHGIGTWASPFVTNAIPFASVIATLLIAVGAATGFSGDWRRIGLQARRQLGFAAVVALFTMVGMLAFALPVALVRPRRAPDLIVIFVVGWVTTLIGFAVSRVRTSEEWRRAARKDYKRRVRCAEKAGFADAAVLKLPVRVPPS